MPSRVVLNALSIVTVCQHGHKLYRTAMPSLICMLCMWPVAFERNYYIPSWHRKLASVQMYFSLPLASPTENIEKYGWLARQ